MLSKKPTQYRFVLQGFSQDQSCREFTFEGIEESRARTEFRVRADLTLARTYGIQIQDLPLLCREVLERRADSEEARRLTFTEEEMRQHQSQRIAAKLVAAQRKRSPQRRSYAVNTASGWRTTPLGIQSGS